MFRSWCCRATNLDRCTHREARGWEKEVRERERENETIAAVSLNFPQWVPKGPPCRRCFLLLLPMGLSDSSNLWMYNLIRHGRKRGKVEQILAFFLSRWGVFDNSQQLCNDHRHCISGEIRAAGESLPFQPARALVRGLTSPAIDRSRSVHVVELALSLSLFSAHDDDLTRSVSSSSSSWASYEMDGRPSMLLSLTYMYSLGGLESLLS